MNVHHLQHVVFEGLGSMEAVLKNKGHSLSSTHLYKNENLPLLDDIDMLIIMGGPMGIYEEEKYPWLVAEKQFIKKAIDAGKIVLGICLGAQLIADVLGAKVYKNKHKEIGWFPITALPKAEQSILSQVFPEKLEVFHWHGDTFDIPKNALAFAESKACKNQGFILNDRVVALQFHLETTYKSAIALIENSRNELDDSKFVQTEKEMLSHAKSFSPINQIMSKLLDALEKKNDK